MQYFFQFYMDLNFKAINGITANNILIVGDNSSSLEGHDYHLIQVLNKCHEICLKLYPDKCIFFGHLVNSTGLKPDPKKIKAITSIQVPQNKIQLQSFVRFYNYLSYYVPHLTDMLSPLRALTAKSIEFKWERLYTESFRKAKHSIANSCTLQYFNSEDPITTQVDVSSIGIGAALMQQGRVVSYHSRALTPTQQRYSNREHECYGLVNGIEHSHHYICCASARPPAFLPTIPCFPSRLEGIWSRKAPSGYRSLNGANGLG